jgi:transcriptional regulator with XRE-family HTH domain
LKITRLREWREARGQTQAELSQRSGVSEHTISGVERGASLRVSTAKKLADALGISVVDLMDKPPVASAGKAEAPESGQRSSRSDSPKVRDPELRPIDLALDAARRQAVLTRQAFNRAATSGVPQGENMRPLNEAFGTLRDRNPGDVAEGLVDLAREYVALEQEAAGIREQVAALQEELARERARVR